VWSLWKAPTRLLLVASVTLDCWWPVADSRDRLIRIPAKEVAVMDAADQRDAVTDAEEVPLN
jgi:hypothetical protein